MKHICQLSALLSLILLSAVQSSAQKAYFVNLKSGDIQVFWSDWVERMNLSTLDLDSIDHQDFVTQEIWTCDSVVRIPLADIEKISFIAPPTEYYPGVVRFEDGLRPYITACDGLTITLSQDVPQSLLPPPNTKVCTIIQDDVFPDGFVGRVESINRDGSTVVMQCSPVELEDIFISLCVGAGVNEPEKSSQAPRKAPWDNWTLPEWLQNGIYSQGELIWHPEPFERDFALNLPVSISKKFKSNENKYFGVQDIAAELPFTVNNHVLFRGVLIISHGTRYATISGYGRHSIAGDIRFSGAINHGWEKSLTDKVKLRIPNVPFLFIGVDAGPFIRADFDASIDASYRLVFDTSFRGVYSNDTEHESLRPSPPSITSNADLSYFNLNSFAMDGSISAGAFLEFNMFFVDKGLAKGYFRLDGGLKLDANVALPLSDLKKADTSTDFYEQSKDSGYNVSFFAQPSCGITVGGELANIDPLWEFGVSLSGELTKTLWERKLFPDFDDIKCSQKYSHDFFPEKHTYDLSCSVSNNCFPDQKLGFIALDTKNASSKIETSFSSEYSTLKRSIEGINPGKTYSLHPAIALGDSRIIASPNKIIEKQIEVHTTEAENIKETEATLNGYISLMNPSALYYYDALRFMYAPKGSGNWIQSSRADSFGPSDGRTPFNINLGNLKPDTEYEYYAAYDSGKDIAPGEIFTFKTKKADTCNVDFTIKYATHDQFYREPKKEPFIGFSVFAYIEPTPELDKEKPQFGIIKYKDGVEISRGRLYDYDDYGWGTFTVPLNELSIDPSQYIAKADKSKYELGIYIKRIDENGKEKILESTIRHELSLVYDEKPACFIYDLQYFKTCVDEDDMHIHDADIAYQYIQYGGLWLSPYPSHLDGDTFYQNLQYDDALVASTTHLRNELLNVTVPSHFVCEMIDVNGKSWFSNVIDLPKDSNGCPVPFHIDLRSSAPEGFSHYPGPQNAKPKIFPSQNGSSSFEDSINEDSYFITEDNHIRLIQKVE